MLQCFLFIIYPKNSEHIHSICIFFYFKDFPQLIIEYFLSSPQIFSSSLGIPIIHIFNFWGFFSKAVNFPLIA